MAKNIYINFPISLIRDAFTNIRHTVDLIFKYAVYKHTEHLKHGTDLEKMKEAAHFFAITFGDIEDSLRTAKALGKGNAQ